MRLKSRLEGLAAAKPAEAGLGRDRARRRWDGSGRLQSRGAVAGMGVVLVLLSALLLLRNGGVLGLDPFLPTAPPGWQTYHDALGLFRLRLPATWQAQAYTGGGSYGDATGSATEPSESVSFSDTALGDASARLSVNAEPIRTSFERHWFCQGWTQRWLSFHGIPTQLFRETSLIFDTANAHFQVDLWIPGVTGGPTLRSLATGRPPTPTPLPAKTVASDISLLSMILGSFQPTNATPLSCP